MALPQVVTQEQWLAARIELLEQEKALTRARDALSAQRRRLPMVEIEKDYRLRGPRGEVGLLDLFEGRRQLIVRHFMFDPDWAEGCSSCTAGSDEISEGMLEHLAARDATMAHVSRAPLEKIERYKWQRAWSFPWYSSFGSDFNRDFGVTLGDMGTYNYRGRNPPAAVVTGSPDTLGEDAVTTEAPGTSFFLRDGARVFHTYSTYARGAEWTGGSYAWLDLTPLGRQEEWEEPKGRADDPHVALPNFAT
jgi:predicted dithiol-disulfide oxidoreductase (DUF899 family)